MSALCSFSLILLDSGGTWGVLILAQTDEHFPKLCLSSTLCTTTDALSTEINKLGYPLPARSAGCRVLTLGQEVFGVFFRGGNGLVLLVVIVLVKVVNGLLGSLDGLGLAVSRDLVAVSNGEVAAFAPFADDVWLFLVGE